MPRRVSRTPGCRFPARRRQGRQARRGRGGVAERLDLDVESLGFRLGGLVADRLEQTRPEGPELELLEEQPGCFPVEGLLAQPGDVHLWSIDILPVQQNLAFAVDGLRLDEVVETVQATQQRALARVRRAKNHRDLIGWDVQADILERHVVVVAERQVPDRKFGHSYALTSSAYHWRLRR